MVPNHHPDPATLMAYAAGSVCESFSLLVAAHSEGCPSCNKALRQAELFAASLIMDMPAAEMICNAESCWSIAEERDDQSATGQMTDPEKRSSVLSAFLPDDLAEIDWRMLVPGIQHHPLKDVESEAGSVRLLRIAPNVVIPDHTHLGSELTLVLQGSYSDETGHYMAGDLCEVDSSVNHRPVVDSSVPCICIIATDQRLSFSGSLNRIIQPLIGI